jgi:hypothetical protein
LYDDEPESRLTQNWGLFAESTYGITSCTRVPAGLRGDYTRIETREVSCSSAICVNLTAADGTRIWHALAFKLRGGHDLSPANLMHLSLSTAFLPADVGVTTGANGAPTASDYEPETLVALERRSKNRFFSGSLQLDGDVNYYRYGGRQQPVSPGAAGGPVSTPVMDSPARMLGAELEGIYQPTPNQPTPNQPTPNQLTPNQLTPNDRFALNLSYTGVLCRQARAIRRRGRQHAHLRRDSMADVAQLPAYVPIAPISIPDLSRGSALSLQLSVCRHHAGVSRRGAATLRHKCRHAARESLARVFVAAADVVERVRA